MSLDLVVRKRRIFPGWWMLVAAILVQGIAFGASSWAFGAFFNPLEEDFGWSRAEVSGSLAASALAAGLLAPFAGRLTDRQGVRRMFIAGAIVGGLGFAILCFMSALWQLYLGNIVIAVGRMGVTGIPVNILVGSWFVKKRVVALGIAWTGGPLGGTLLVPLASQLIPAFGWRSTMAVLGVLVVVMVLPLAAWLVKNKPADIGLLPDGEPPESAPGARLPDATASVPVRPVQEGIEWTARLAIRTTAFWYLSLSFILIYFAYHAINAHLVPFMRWQGTSAQAAGAIVGMIAFLTVAGRLLAGFGAGRLQVTRVLLGCTLSQTAALVLIIALRGNPATIWILVLTHGMIAGGIPTLEPAMIMERFGMRGLGSVLGMVDFVRIIGVSMGPVVAGWIFDITRGYNAALIVFAASYLFGAALLYFTVPSRRPALAVGT